MKNNKYAEGKTLNENNGNWRGDDVSYAGLHYWVRSRIAKPDACEKCSKKDCKMELALKEKPYSRELSNWFYLCISCHRKHDSKAYSEAAKRRYAKV